MYNLQLSAEQIEIRDTVRDFATKELKPAAIKSARMEALDHSPMWDLLDKASQMGLRALRLSEELGGAGADALTASIVSEELAVGDPDTAAILAETSAVARVLYGKAMSKAQRDKYLPAFMNDDRYHLAHASAAPQAEIGINYHRPAAPPAATVTAKSSGGDFILHGTAAAVANAPIAKLIAVEAKVDGAKGISTFIVPAGTKGLSVKELPLGRYVGSCGEVTLKDCRIPADQLLGKGGDGVMLNGSTLSMQAINLGIGRVAYEDAVDYARIRVQGAKNLIEHQAIGTKLAESAIRLEVARNTLWKAAWLSDNPEAIADGSASTLPIETMSHVFIAEQIHRATKDCAECFGAMGVMRDMPLWKYIRDARMLLHSGTGVSDAKLAIAEAISGFRREGA
jgi:butyryl-CoA dehydrogenase